MAHRPPKKAVDGPSTAYGNALHHDHEGLWLLWQPKTFVIMKLGLITARSGGATNTLQGDEGVGEGVDGGQVGRQVVGQAVPGSDGRGRGVGHLRLARVVPYDDLQRQVERAER